MIRYLRTCSFSTNRLSCKLCTAETKQGVLMTILRTIGGQESTAVLSHWVCRDCEEELHGPGVGLYDGVP